MADQNLGWVKDKFDPHDFLHPTMKLAVLPNSVPENRQWLPTIRNQGNIGSCVGHGVGGNLVARAKKLGIYTDWFSPTWIYNGARYLEGKLAEDAGCEPGDAYDWLFKMGTLLEHFWPYDPKKLDTSAPSSTRQAQAVKYADFKYLRCVDGVDGICSALADHQYVSIGNPWFAKWMDAPGGVLADVTAQDALNGGHETCLYDYDRSAKVFFGFNSWGPGWGDGGKYIMPFSAIAVFKQLWGYDAQYMTFTATPNPVPAPTGCCPAGRSLARAALRSGFSFKRK